MTEIKMSKEAIEMRRLYYANYRKANPTKKKIYEATYWNKKAEQAKAE